jgi:hypothetical protein
MSSVIIEKQQIYKAAGVVCLLLIGFFTWIVITTYGNKSTGEIILIKVENIEKNIDKINVSMKDYNAVLQTKADKIENDKAHDRLSDQFDLIIIQLHEYRAGRSYGNNNQSSFTGYSKDKPSILVPIISNDN